MEPAGSLPHSQASATRPYPGLEWTVERNGSSTEPKLLWESVPKSPFSSIIVLGLGW